MSLRRGRKTLPAMPFLYIERLETRSLLNGNSILDALQPRLSPPPGHEPGLYSWHRPLALPDAQPILIVSAPPNEIVPFHNDGSASDDKAPPADLIDKKLPPLHDRPKTPESKNEAADTVNTANPTNTGKEKDVGLTPNNQSPKLDAQDRPTLEPPITPDPPVERPALPEVPKDRPPVGERPVVPNVDTDNPWTPPNDPDLPSLPNGPADKPPLPTYKGDRPDFDGNPNPGNPPPLPENRPILAMYFAWAQAEASRSLALAMSGAAYEPAPATSYGGSETGSVDSAESTDKQLLAALGDSNDSTEPSASDNEGPTEIALLPGSFTPQQSELLGAALALDVDALGQGAMRFFHRLDQLGNELTSSEGGIGLSSWVLAALATCATLEIIRRNRKPALMPELATNAADLSWTWSLGASEPPGRL